MSVVSIARRRVQRLKEKTKELKKLFKDRSGIKIKRPVTWGGDSEFWYYCDDGCDSVLVEEAHARSQCSVRYCKGELRYMSMTEEEYKKYRPLLEKIGVPAFAKSLRDHNVESWFNQERAERILAWEKDMGI